MKKIHKKRAFNRWVSNNKRDTLQNQRQIHDASKFQEWYAKMGGMIENDDMEKVIERFQ